MKTFAPSTFNLHTPPSNTKFPTWGSSGGWAGPPAGAAPAAGAGPPAPTLQMRLPMLTLAKACNTRACSGKCLVLASYYSTKMLA